MRCIRFGPFELNSQTYELRKGGKQAKIQQQPARVLALLASAPGTLITREQIRAAIWGAETFVDFEQSLNFCIRQIRLILDDSASHPVFIETLPRLGYRFIAPVEQATERPAIAGQPRIRIGVLPMDEMGASVEDYFAQGLTEDLISALSRVNPERLRVVSGPRLGTDSPTLAELERVGRDLHLDFLLRGWVRRSPGAVRVCTQLHDLHDRSVLWSETYDRSAADLSALQEEVTRRVSRSLAFELIPASSAGPRKYARSPAAYDSYLKGRYFWHKMTREAMESSIHYFRDAIALDPSFAPAYAGLADCYAQMGSIRLAMMKPLEALQKATPLVERAMEIDSTLAEAHCTLALLKSWYELDWEGADRQFQQALNLEPDNLSALLWRSLLLSALGRHQEALASVRRAFESNPLSPIVNTYLGVAHAHAGEYDLAFRKFKEALELDPYYYRAYMFLGRTLTEAERYPEAITAYRKALALNPDNLESLAYMGQAVASAGDRDEALNIVAQVKAWDVRYEPALLIACIYAGLGEAAEMFQWLEVALEQKSGPLYVVPLTPRFRQYGSHPQYHLFFEKLGLHPAMAPVRNSQYSD